MDPATFALISQVGIPVLKSILGGGDQAAQLAQQQAIAAAQARAAADAQQKWLIAGALVGGAALVAILLRDR